MTASRRGSSPLARGLLLAHAAEQGVTGIIPARAGFTPAGRRAARGDADHPRSRGVYCARSVSVRTRTGSSPLARGLPLLAGLVPVSAGIIPARAGFTRPGSWRRPGSGDHPRSRGVYPGPDRGPNHCRGSSPLARGLHMTPVVVTSRDGIIPARAGFTIPGPSWPPQPRDHPRSRGVYSPRMRSGP